MAYDAGPSQPRCACDVLHLHAILSNLDQILHACFSKLGPSWKPLDHESYDEILSDTITEILRLVQYPSLFPSVTVRKVFKRELATLYGKITQVCNSIKDFKDKCENCLELDAQEHERTRFPPAGTQLHPWLNLLKKGAPGVTYDPLSFPVAIGAGVVQALPESAHAIMQERLFEAKEFLRDLGEVSHEKAASPNILHTEAI